MTGHNPTASAAGRGRRPVGTAAGVLLLVLASGCALGPRGAPAPVEERSSEAAPPAAVAPVPAVDAGTDAAVVRPLGEGRVSARPLEEDLPDSARPLHPAVVALLDTASRHERAGDRERAAATLERAIEIEPRNAWLWHRLARVRLEQARYGEAESIAAKSSSLEPGNARLVADNWRLVARARAARGDHAGAREAEAYAERLRPAGE